MIVKRESAYPSSGAVTRCLLDFSLVFLSYYNFAIVYGLSFPLLLYTTSIPSGNQVNSSTFLSCVDRLLAGFWVFLLICSLRYLKQILG